MNKLILDQNFKHLIGLFKLKNYTEFENKFKQLDSLQVLCEKSYNLFGLYSSSLRKYDQSIYYFIKSLSINSDYVQSKINLASVYLLTGKIKEAKQLADEVLKNDDKNIMALFLIAETEGLKNDFKSVKKIFDKIEDIDPANFQTYYKFAQFYFKNSLYKEAEEYFKKTLQLRNNFLEAKYNYAQTLKKLCKFRELIDYLEIVIKKHKREKSFYYLLSDTYRGLGDFENSNRILSTILKNFEKNDPKSISHLIASSRAGIKNDDFIKEVEDSYESANEDFKERVGYALFQYHDKGKNYKQASNYLSEAINITHKKHEYDYNIEKQQFNFLKDCFDEKYFEKFQKTNSSLNFEQKINIFIVGLHRSGSTLLEQMLSSNPKFTSYGELPYFADLITKNFPDQNLINFKSEIHETKIKKFLSIGEEYNFKLSLTSNFSLDKMLSNFRMVGFISTCIPNSVIVHIHRNKNDNLFSILSNYYEYNEALWSYNIKNLLQYYDDYNSLMRHWKKFLNHKIIDIKYEEIISNPKEELSKILNILNLKWNDNYLNYTKNKNLVETASVYQVREKLYNSSINKWKNYESYFKDLFV